MSTGNPAVAHETAAHCVYFLFGMGTPQCCPASRGLLSINFGNCKACVSLPPCRVYVDIVVPEAMLIGFAVWTSDFVPNTALCPPYMFRYSPSVPGELTELCVSSLGLPNAHPNATFETPVQ